jgi:hypothetical protein
MIFNFFGLITFYCPCLVLHLKRIKTNRNCLLFCYKHSFQIDSLHVQTANQANTSSSSPASMDQPPQPSEQLHKDKNVVIEQQATVKLSRFLLVRKVLSRVYKFYSCVNTSNVNYLKYKKLKMVFFTIFVAYFIFNFTITITRLKINFPMVDLLPKESYLTKHMHNHVNLFNLGPIIILNFVRPLRYWENATFTRITNMINEMRQLDGISGLEINWLTDVYAQKDSSYSQEFIDECVLNGSKSNPFVCFTKNLASYLQEQQNRDDCTFGFTFRNASIIKSSMDTLMRLENVRYPDELMIKSSRLYLQMKDFKGVRSEPELIHNLRELALYKYNFTEDALIVFTNIGLYLEQLEEIYPTIISMFLITFEVSSYLTFLLNSILLFKKKSR